MEKDYDFRSISIKKDLILTLRACTEYFDCSYSELLGALFKLCKFTEGNEIPENIAARLEDYFVEAMNTGTPDNLKNLIHIYKNKKSWKK